MTENEIERIVICAQRIAEIIFEAWDPFDPDGPLYLEDNRTAIVQSDDWRTDTGFILQFSDFMPILLITPMGTWRFTNRPIIRKRPSNNIMIAWQKLVQDLSLQEFTHIGQPEPWIFYYEIHQAKELTFGPTKMSNLTDENEEDEALEEAWAKYNQTAVLSGLSLE